MEGDSLVNGLTERQREAVLHDDGPLLVLAGAGSGKTRVITRRAARLAARVGSQRVLAITFTNKASNEMKRRVEELGVDGGMWVCTFHSLCVRLLRRWPEAGGLRQGFTIFDQADRTSAVKQAIDDCGLSAERWRPRSMEQQISAAKNNMQSPAAYAEAAKDFVAKSIARIYTRYDALLREQNAVDFDDLLLLTAVLLRDQPPIREQLEDRFCYVLIDEYQDTNHAQYLIARGLTQARRNLCATGDPDQSIYGWRGANIENILDFERDYPDARVVRLEQNFRSTRRILSAAGTLIARNKRRKKKDIWTENDSGDSVRLWICGDEQDEARRIAEDIRAYVAGGGLPGHVAIFYRVTALTRVLEEALRRAQLPYQIARGVEFYNRKEIKDVLSYVRFIVNPADETAAVRAIGTPSRGIGKTTIERLSQFARSQQVTFCDALARCDEIEAIKSGSKKVAAFSKLVAELAALPRFPVRSFLESLVRLSGMEGVLKADPDPEQPALQNVGELISAAAEYDAANPEGSAEEWLAQISLVSDADAVDEAAGAVTLMTLHAAKGLEFPVVYIAGLEQGLLPHQRAIEDNRDDLEEERRLFFVGMTRAMRRLTLTRSMYRMMRGFSERTIESAFTRELPRAELEVSDFARGGDDHDDGGDDAFDVDERLLTRGRLVRHAEYGVGRITWVETARGRPWVRVEFAAYGVKSFTLQFAELEVVEA